MATSDQPVKVQLPDGTVCEVDKKTAFVIEALHDILADVLDGNVSSISIVRANEKGNVLRSAMFRTPESLDMLSDGLLNQSQLLRGLILKSQGDAPQNNRSSASH